MDKKAVFDTEYDLNEDFSINVKFTQVDPLVVMAREEQERIEKEARMEVMRQFEENRMVDNGYIFGADFSIDTCIMQDHKHDYTKYVVFIVSFVFIYTILRTLVYCIFG